VSDQPQRTPSSGSDMARGMTQASWGLSVAFGFVGVVLAGFFLGRFIDGRLDTEPWAQVVGSIAGWVLGVVLVYYGAQRRVG
jgi:F0F1-type ATP synthase assembly protein I